MEASLHSVCDVTERARDMPGHIYLRTCIQYRKISWFHSCLCLQDVMYSFFPGLISHSDFCPDTEGAMAGQIRLNLYTDPAKISIMSLTENMPAKWVTELIWSPHWSRVWQFICYLIEQTIQVKFLPPSPYPVCKFKWPDFIYNHVFKSKKHQSPVDIIIFVAVQGCTVLLCNASNYPLSLIL